MDFSIYMSDIIYFEMKKGKKKNVKNIKIENRRVNRETMKKKTIKEDPRLLKVVLLKSSSESG